jgi:UDP:flavonoid glycosyltransferase YjiC (YdhE family)
MSRILFCWELGQNLGHILGFLPVALELRKRGHEVVFVLRDLSRVEQTLGQYDFTCLPCPLWIPKAPNLPPQLSYCEMLFRFGFLDPDGLTGLVKAWRSLFELSKADLLVIDHAPTALLAASGLGIPRALFGTGFFNPPRTVPLRPFRWWQKAPLERLVKSEARVLATINSVRANTGLPKLRAVQELFDTEESFLCTLPELDHYPGRKDAVYWGPRFSLDSGDAPHWPEGDSKRVFCYLYPHHRHFEAVLGALSQLPVSAVVYAPRLSPAVKERFASGSLCFSEGAVNMEAARQGCDLAVCHGGHGTVSAMLLAGKPLLLLPSQLEQAMMSRCIVQHNLGLMVNADEKQLDFRQVLERLLGDSAFAESARAFAGRHANFNHARQVGLIADRCEVLLG